MPKKRTRDEQPAVELSCEYLERAALAYLNRFDTSKANLRRVLSAKVARSSGAFDIAEQQTNVTTGAALIDAVVARLSESGVLNDLRYSVALARSERARGSSSRLIAQKLERRGVPTDLVQQALNDVDADVGSDDVDPELAAARSYVKRRKLGPHRSSEERQAKQRSDLAALARRGFSMSVARRALEL